MGGKGKKGRAKDDFSSMDEWTQNVLKSQVEWFYYTPSAWTYSFDYSLDGMHRKFVHKIAEEYGMVAESFGKGEWRYIQLSWSGGQDVEPGSKNKNKRKSGGNGKGRRKGNKRKGTKVETKVESKGSGDNKDEAKEVEKIVTPMKVFVSVGLSGDGTPETFDVTSGSTVEDLKDLIQKRLGKCPFSQSLVFQEVLLADAIKTLAEYNVQDESTIILLERPVPEHFLLDENKKTGTVVFSEGVVDFGSASGKYDQHGTILGKEPLAEGIHKFRVRVVSGKSLYVGVAEKEGYKTRYAGDTSKQAWWYYDPSGMTTLRLISPNGIEDWGSKNHLGLHPGDSVTLEVDTMKGTVSCARDDDELKPAFSGLVGKELYIALCMDGVGKLELDTTMMG